MAKLESKYKLPAAFPIYARKTLPRDALEASLADYEKGQYLDALRHLEGQAPMQAWRNPDAQVLGYRLAGNMAAPRLASVLIRRAARQSPRDAKVAVHYGYHLLAWRGPMGCWRHALQAETFARERPEMLADLKAMRANIAASYRDFDTAWRLWDEAWSIHPGSAWLLLERAEILLSQERREEAQDFIRQSLEKHPWYRPAVQWNARVLHLQGRREDAIAFLTQAQQHLQSYGATVQLLSLKREVDDHEGMEALIQRVQELSVIAETAEQEWLQARRVDVACLKGDFVAAAAAAEKVSGTYHENLARRLRTPGLEPSRVRLPFEFVHQKHNTCAPATLAAVAHYWRKPVTMEQIVDEICYDGTQDFSERRWAEANNFSTREFTVTLEAVRLLIDAHVPIVLTTVEPGSAHSQAIIGYDDVRQSLFIQDPSEPHYREVQAEEFLGSYKLTGPRGLALVPADQTVLLKSLPLPDAAVYDLNHVFSSALASYDRKTAESALGEMETIAPGHQLLLLGRLWLASFDGNEVARDECLKALEAAFPDDTRVRYWQAHSLRSLGGRNQRLTFLRDQVRSKAVPLWALRMLAEELMDDARQWSEARRILNTAHSAAPADTAVLVRLADFLRRSQQAPAEEWLTVYRFAASLSDKVEGFAQLWFNHATQKGRTEEALEWLRRRMREYGGRSGAPAITLVQALDMLGRPEMLTVVREAVTLRPDDGDLLLELARVEMRLGRLEDADALLLRAERATAPAAWQRARAMFLRRRDGPSAEQKIWLHILEREPLALDAHQVIARHLAGEQGNPAAIAHLKHVVGRFPHHYGLSQLLVQWEHDSDTPLCLPQLQRMIEIHPNDPWAHRELALVMRELNRHAEAEAAAHHAVSLAPDQAASYAILGSILLSQGRQADGMECLRQGIRLDVNHGFSFEALVHGADNNNRQRAELAFIRSEMIRQVLNGAGLHSYRSLASVILDPQELHRELIEIWQARPDLWEAWSVLIQQKMDLGMSSEALECASQAVERFPLTPGAWKDLAAASRHQGGFKSAIEAIGHACRLNPDWQDGWLVLAELQEDSGQAAEAAATLRHACQRLPLDMQLRAALASMLWRTEAREEAWKLAERTALEEPGQDWAWSMLRNWGETLQRQDRVLQLGRSLTQQRPQDTRSWMILARLLPVEDIQQSLEAIQRALAIDPRLIDAYDLRAETLSRLGRVDEAEASLNSGPWNNVELPYILCGRIAWLQAVRGDIAGAIRRMKVVLDNHTNYYWGWLMLAQWAEQRSDLSHWRQAAQEMIRLNPRSAEPYNTAADAELSAGRRDEGVRQLRQALHVEPGNAYAAHRWLNLLWEAREIPELTAAADSLITHGMVGLVRRVYLMLAAAQRADLVQARQDLEWLATQTDMIGPLLELVQKCFHGQDRKLQELFSKVLDETAREGRIGPAFAILWVQEQQRRNNWDCWRQLADWLPRLGTRLTPAIAAYLDLLGDSMCAEPHLARFIQNTGEFLRERGELWGKVSYAFTASRRYKDCIHWMQNDFRRPDAEGWMLSNLAVSFLETQSKNRAIEVSRHVVEQGLRDSTWAAHVAIASHGAVIEGDYGEALRIASLESTQDRQSGWSFITYLAQLEASVLSQPSKQAKQIFAGELANLRSRISTAALSSWMQHAAEAAIERMRSYCGIRFMPWNRPRFKAPRQEGSGGLPGWSYGIILMLLFNILRSCAGS